MRCQQWDRIRSRRALLDRLPKGRFAIPSTNLGAFDSRHCSGQSVQPDELLTPTLNITRNKQALPMTISRPTLTLSLVLAAFADHLWADERKKEGNTNALLRRAAGLAHVQSFQKSMLLTDKNMAFHDLVLLCPTKPSTWPSSEPLPRPSARGLLQTELAAMAGLHATSSHERNSKFLRVQAVDVVWSHRSPTVV